MIRAAITAVEHHVPDRVLSNADLEKIVDTNDEWIVTRTGIKERRIVEPGTGASDLILPALQKMITDGRLVPEELDAIVVGTVTPDMIFPATACLIQDKIGAYNAFGFDLSAACSGFLYSLTTGAAFIESGRFKKVLVVGVDVMSAIVDYEDRTTCIIFGDGGGAVLLEAAPDENHIIDFKLRVDGSGIEHLHMKAGGSLRPPSHETVDNREHFVFQDGKQVFKAAVKDMADISAEVLESNGFRGEDVKLFVPHQANIRIIEAAAKRMKLRDDQVLINIEKYGNTTSGTIPIGLSEASREGRITKGDLVVLAAFGGGYTWGGMILRWAI